MPYSAINSNDPLKTKKETVFNLFKEFLELDEVKSRPTMLMSYMPQLNKELEAQGTDFTVMSVILNSADRNNISLGKAYGQFSDGTKWGFSFSDFLN